MKVEFSHDFIKIFKKRFKNKPTIKKKFDTRTRMFESNSENPVLKNHALKGKKIGLRAFSITGDIRVVFYIEKGTAYFVDIGTHNQVY